MKNFSLTVAALVLASFSFAPKAAHADPLLDVANWADEALQATKNATARTSDLLVKSRVGQHVTKSVARSGVTARALTTETRAILGRIGTVAKEAGPAIVSTAAVLGTSMTSVILVFMPEDLVRELSGEGPQAYNADFDKHIEEVLPEGAVPAKVTNAQAAG